MNHRDREEEEKKRTYNLEYEFYSSIPKKDKKFWNTLFVSTNGNEDKIHFRNLCYLKNLNIYANWDVEKITFDNESICYLKRFSIRHSKVRIESILNSLSNSCIEHICLADNNIKISLGNLVDLIFNCKSNKGLLSLKTLDISNIYPDDSFYKKYKKNFKNSVWGSKWITKDKLKIYGIEVILSNCRTEIDLEFPVQPDSEENLGIPESYLDESPISTKCYNSSTSIKYHDISNEISSSLSLEGGDLSHKNNSINTENDKESLSPMNKNKDEEQSIKILKEEIDLIHKTYRTQINSMYWIMAVLLLLYFILLICLYVYYLLILKKQGKKSKNKDTE